MSEKAIERHLRSEVTRRGGLCLKYANAMEAGYPDRLVILPVRDGNTHVWVELKSGGRKPTPLQLRRHGELRRLGEVVLVIDSREGVDGLMRAYDDMFGEGGL